MDRRNFLRSLVGGVAATAAVRTWPFRVYSFPSELTQDWRDYLRRPLRFFQPDYYVIHWPTHFPPGEATLGALHDLMEAGQKFIHEHSVMVDGLDKTRRLISDWSWDNRERLAALKSYTIHDVPSVSCPMFPTLKTKEGGRDGRTT